MKLIRALLFLLLFAPVYTSFSQTATIDSLQRALNTHIKKDTVRVNLLNNLASKIFTSEADRALRLLKESESLASEIHFKIGQAYAMLFAANALIAKSDFKAALGQLEGAMTLYEGLRDKEGIANTSFNFGRTYFYLGEYDKVESHYRRAIALCEETGDVKRHSASLIGLGALYNKFNDFDKGLAVFKKALQIDEKLGNKKGISNALINLGNLYKRKGEYANALEAYLRSAEIKKELGDMLNVATNYGNIGTVYDDMDRKQEALRYYQMAMPVFQKLNHLPGISRMSTNIGIILMNTGDYKNAREHFIRATKIMEDTGSKDEIASNIVNLATLDMHEKKYDSALALFKKAEHLNLEIKNMRDQAYCYKQMGKIYLERNELEKALEYGKKSEALSKQYKLVSLERDAVLLLSDVYYATKQYKLAYEKRADHKVLTDSIFNEESVGKLVDVKYEYKYKDQLKSANQTVAQKEGELETSRQEKLWWIGGSITLLISFGFVLALVKIRKVKMENRQLLTEQKLRRSQMNPHFIFNSLQNVNSLIREKKEDEAVQYLNQFSKLTRQILESSDENYMSLEEEIDLIQNYVSIQQMLYGNAFSFKITVDEKLDPESVFLPPMLTQPFIENAIKHGLKDKSEGVLEIRFLTEGDKLFFEVTDNGAGFGSHKSQNHKSMAMDITRKRLSFYTKNKAPEVSAQNITDALQNIVGAKVRFEIPYLYEN